MAVADAAAAAQYIYIGIAVGGREKVRRIFVTHISASVLPLGSYVVYTTG